MIEVDLNSRMKEYILKYQYEIFKKADTPMDRSKNFEIGRTVLKEYEIYLKQELVKNPFNVPAACQLASILEISSEKNLLVHEELEKFLKKNIERLTDKEKCRIYLNLAYYFEEWGDNEKCIIYLEEAAGLGLDYFNIHGELGRIYSDMGMYGKAVKYAKTAYERSNNDKYIFGYAVIMIKTGEYEKALKILNELLERNLYNIQYMFYKVLCNIYLGDKDCSNVDMLIERIREFEALQESDTEKYLLWARKNDFEYIDEDRVNELYYLCGIYEKFSIGFEKILRVADADYIAPYFYSLKMTEEHEKLKKKFEEYRNHILEEIELIKNDEEYREGKKEEEIIEEIENKGKKLKDFILMYEKIINTDFKPEIKIDSCFIYECYMPDCPHHMNITTEV